MVKERFILLTGACLLAGCRSEAPRTRDNDPDQFDPTTWASPHTPLVRQDAPTAAARGMPPLVYQAPRPGPVRVVDETADAFVAAGTAKALDVVLVETDGVRIGQTRVSDVPLPAEHTYTIYLDVPFDRGNRGLQQTK